ncbi:MAG: tetratricopeptide repeat protein [Promethearchaeota archaeon]
MLHRKKKDKKFKKKRDKETHSKRSKKKYKFVQNIEDEIVNLNHQILELKNFITGGMKNLDLWARLIDFLSLRAILIDDIKDFDQMQNSTKLDDKLEKSIALYQEGYAAYRRGDFDQAEKKLRDSISLFEENIISIFTLANIFYLKRDYERAESTLNKCLNFCDDPTASKVLTNMGMIALKNNDLKKAETFLLKALEFDDKNSFSLNNLGLLHEMKGNIKKAIEYYKQASIINPNDHEIWYNLGNLLGKTGDKGARLFCFMKAEDLGFPELGEIIDDLVDQNIKPKDPFSK